MGSVFFLLAGDRLIDAHAQNDFSQSLADQDAKKAFVKAVFGYALSLLLLPMSNANTRSSPALVVRVRYGKFGMPCGSSQLSRGGRRGLCTKVPLRARAWHVVPFLF